MQWKEETPMSEPRENGLGRRQFVKLVVAGGTLAAAPAASAQTGKAKLTVWTQSSFTKQADAAIKGLYESYGKEHNVDVDFQIMAYNTLIEKLPAALEAGTPPDISFLYDADTAYYRGRAACWTSPTWSSPSRSSAGACSMRR